MSRHSRRSPYSPVESSYLEPYDGSVTRPKELAEAVEDFYLGLDDAISAAKRSSRHATLESEAQLGPAFDVETIVYDDAAEGKDIASEDKYDEDGWETGYLSHWRSSVQGNLTLDDRRRGVNIPDNATAARDTLSGGHGAPTANPRSRGSPRSSHCGPNDLSDGDDGQYRSTSPTC